ncbi:hypothetical protein GRC12_27010 [Streptomyces griseorubiginosus]|nr:hypothetical protein [Streptomyces griseorubiginosus]
MPNTKGPASTCRAWSGRAFHCATAPDSLPPHALAEDNLAAESPDLLHALRRCRQPKGTQKNVPLGCVHVPGAFCGENPGVGVRQGRISGRGPP